jgi:hypothetical protein
MKIHSSVLEMFNADRRTDGRTGLVDTPQEFERKEKLKIPVGSWILINGPLKRMKLVRYMYSIYCVCVFLLVSFQAQGMHFGTLHYIRNLVKWVCF